MNPDDDDIARLFAQFGGDPGTYQEIATVAAAKEARARWPVLSAFDPLASTAAPAVGADDAAVLAQARRSASDAQAHEVDAARPRARFMPPSPKPFSREIPSAFLVPIAPDAPADPAAAHAASPDPIPAPRVEPTMAPALAAAPQTDSKPAPSLQQPAPSPAPQAESVAAAMPILERDVAPGAGAEPATADTAAPTTQADPFRRLAASDGGTARSPRLPDLFNRLLSS